MEEREDGGGCLSPDLEITPQNDPPAAGSESGDTTLAVLRFSFTLRPYIFLDLELCELAPYLRGLCVRVVGHEYYLMTIGVRRRPPPSPFTDVQSTWTIYPVSKQSSSVKSSNIQKAPAPPAYLETRESTS